MMLRYVLLIGLWLISAAACAAPAAPSQATGAQATAEVDVVQAQKPPDEAEDEPDHEEEHDKDHDHEADEGHREHGAHEHGAAELMIAWSGSELAIDLQTPAYNVLGFEYAPTPDDEQALFDESVAALEAGELLQFNPEADCTITSGIVETALAEEAHDHETEEEHHDGEEETHADINVAYNVQCQQPDKLESLDVSQLFAQFPNFEDLRVQWVSDTAQSAKDLTSDDPVLLFK